MYRNILFLVLLSFFIFVLPVQAKHLYSEAEYQNYWCSKHGGITEYRLKDMTRVDCLLPTQAVEFDFAKKWAECIGQSLHYGLMTGKQSACCLILERGEKDLKYLKRLRRIAYKKGVKTYTITPKVFNSSYSAP